MWISQLGRKNEMNEQSKLAHSVLLMLKGFKSEICVNALLHALIHVIKECAPTENDKVSALNKIIKVLEDTK
jgi:hypothetical protein